MRRLLLLITVASGCNTPSYLFETRPLETLQDPMAMGQGGFLADTDLYIIPVRRPTMDEQTLRTEEQTALGLMQPIPWVGLRDFDIEVQYSLKNLENGKVTATLAVNGGSEFGDFLPDNYVDMTAKLEDQTPPPSLLGGTPIELAANETQTGVFREDQVGEASQDLEAIIRYPAPAGPIGTAFQVLLRNSSASRIGLEGIPAQNVMPAMVRYQLTLTASGHVVCDYSVRVRDHASKLAHPTDPDLFVDTAAVIAPPVNPLPPP